jgi:hypothetical protein
MSDTRWCLRCGIRKPLNHFNPDPSKPKRQVENNCLQCLGKVYADPIKPGGVARCDWCRLRYSKIRANQRFCCAYHGQLWYREQRKGQAS